MESDSRILYSPDTGLSDEQLEDNETLSRRMASVAESEWFAILAQIISSTLLFILIFGMSATVDVQHLREQVHNKFAILTGGELVALLSCTFILMLSLFLLTIMLFCIQ